MSDITVNAPLIPVSTLDILGQSYDLAKNGGSFHLVEHREPDAYGRPVARKIEIQTWIREMERQECIGPERVQSLLNITGQSLLRIKSLEDELSRAHTALQREAEPDAKQRRPVSQREVSAGVTGVLEGKGEEG